MLGNMQVIVDITEQSKPSLQVKLDRLSSEVPKHTIFRVHRELRNVNSKTYEPRLIAIGPLHSQNENLKGMEIHKLRYVKDLLGRQQISVQDCISALESREPKARSCYAEAINLNPTEFLEMLVLDACFIIEFANRIQVQCRRNADDPILSISWRRNYVLWDLMLFENQIPLFVIFELCSLMYGPQHQGERIKLLLRVFGELFPVQVYYNEHIDLASVKHLLELIHRSFVLTYANAGEPVIKDGKFRPGEDVIESAVRLADSNVSFARNESGASMFQVNFKHGCMRLPHMGIDDATESFWRNMIAYEQYFLDSEECYFTDFSIVMDCLINTAEDVKLLIQCGIIANNLGSEEAVADMFNKLTDNVIASPGDYFTYKLLFKEVREHCSLKRNKWMAKLKQNHLNSPWAIIPICAAIVLLLLTFLQTVFTVKN